VLDFFGVSLSTSQLGLLQAVARQDAKDPSHTFTDDKARKRQQATPAIQQAAAEWLYPVYERLEAARNSR